MRRVGNSKLVVRDGKIVSTKPRTYTEAELQAAVTAARLATAGAAYEAAALYVDDCANTLERIGGHNPYAVLRNAALGIRTIANHDAVSALDEVKRAARTEALNAAWLCVFVTLRQMADEKCSEKEMHVARHIAENLDALYQASLSAKEVHTSD